MLYQFGRFEVDTLNFTLCSNGELTAVEPKVFDLLVFLIRNRNKLITRQEIFDEIWGGREVSDTSLSNHIKSIRKVLGDDAQLQQIIKTIRGRGYQFIALTKEKTEHSRAPSKPGKEFNKFYFALVASLVFVVLFLVNQQQSDTAQDIQSSRLVAVLPLTNIKPDAETNFLGFALADQIIGKLIYFNDVTVRASSSIRKFDQRLFDPVAAGQSLEVEYILTGNYLKEDQWIRLNFELIDVKSNKLIWREPIEMPYNSVFELQDKIAQKLSQKIGLGLLSANLSNSTNTTPTSPAAYEYYLRSVSYPLTKEDDQLAISMLERAIELAPNYAPNYVELGFRLHHLATFGLGKKKNSTKAENYLLTALSIDKTSLEALRNLATIYTDTGQHLKALRMARRMLKINPNHADAYYATGYIYRYTGMLDLSIQMMEKALSIDPKSRIAGSLGATYYNAGRYQEAIETLKQDPDTPFSLAFLGSVFSRAGHNAKAIQYFDRVIEMNVGDFWVLDAIANKAILTRNFSEGLIAVKQLEQSTINDVEPLYYWASYYAALGERDGAIRLLRKAVDGGYFNLPFMQTDPFFRSIKDDTEFMDIMTRVEQKHLAFKQALAETF